MDNKLPIRWLIICATVAIAAVVLGYFNVLSGDFGIIYEVFQSILAAAFMTAIGEIFASLSKFPIISYIISAVLCAVALQVLTPWYLIMPFADLYQVEKVFTGYRMAVQLCLVVYSAALVVSILFGIFVLHRKDVFNRQK